MQEAEEDEHWVIRIAIEFGRKISFSAQVGKRHDDDVLVLVDNDL